MGHRHLRGSSQMFNDEPDQGWNHIHPEHPYTSQVRSGTSDNRLNVHPAENMLNDGMPVSSHWNSSPVPNYNPGGSGLSHDPFLNSSTVAPFSAPPETYVTFASSSNCNSHTWSNASFVDQSMDNMRGAQKRKSPCPSSIYERGSSSQYHGDRTSSDIPFPSDLRLGKSMMLDHHEQHHLQWPMNPTYQNNTLSIRGGEGSSRNVRSRPTLDLDPSLDRNNLPRSPNRDPHATHYIVEHTASGRFPPGHTSHGNKDWNCTGLPSAPGDINGFSQETNNFLPVRSVVNSTCVDTSTYHHGLVPDRNSIVSHNYPGPSTQSANNAHFSHRSHPTYRASSSSLRPVHVASPPGHRSHLVNETYPSRHLRPLPHISWRSSERPGRRRSSYERFQPPFDEVSLHERFSSEGFMVVDRTPHYGSRNMFDHHRDMRLDIDNMTYEELLALGERIGSVNTGLSNNAISSCLVDKTYYTLYPTEEERKCAICLEEYKETEEVGELKSCGHDYHGSCIKKWLSMKNSCPICKSPAFSDASNNP